MTKRRSVLSNVTREKRRQKTTQIIIGIFIAALMVLSVFGIILGNSSGTTGADVIAEQGYDFALVGTQTGQYWQTELGGIERQFFYLPSQVTSVPASFNQASLQEATLYLAFDPAETNLEVIDYARYTFANDLSAYGQTALSGMTQPSAAYAFPIINCSSTTTPVILFRIGNETSIGQEEYCVVVQGTDQSALLTAFERLRYLYYGFE
jgi:ABC-type glycerol-3-phosphate transport system permease component